MNVIDKEKVNTIEENIPKVYHSGRFNVIKDSTYLKGSESGEHIYLDDVSDIEHTLGVKVSSKNIIPYPYYDKSKTHNGITYTVNDDGSVTANGTATGGTSTFYFTIWSLADKIPHLFEDGETYTIQGKSGSARILLHYKDKETNADKYAQAGGSSATFKVDKTKYKYCHLRIQIDEGSTVDNATIYPTIIKSSIKDQSFTLNVPDLTTVTLRRCSENLIGYPFKDYGGGIYDGLKSQGLTFNINEEDNSIIINGTALYEYYPIIGKVLLEAGKTYTLSGCGEGGGSATYCIYTYHKNSAGTTIYYFDYGSGVSFTPARTSYATVRYSINQGITFDNVVCKPQLTVSPTVQEYKKYIGDKFTPNEDGTVDNVTSIYPITNLCTELNGVVIDCDYYKDIDKAYLKLQQTLALSGGE